MAMHLLRKRAFQIFCTFSFGMILAGCSLSSLVETEPPSGGGITDPGAIANERAAIEMYRGVIQTFRASTSGTGSRYVMVSGMLGDELNAAKFNAASNSFTALSLIDGRLIPEEASYGVVTGYTTTWTGLHNVRIQAMSALGALQKYAPNAPKDYNAHLYALWGMAEVMLANLYCSGIPLSTVEFEGDFEYGAGSTTQQVYEHAVRMFDSSLANVTDSTEIRHLASVGKGWALLNLFQYDAAAAAVASVPTDFVYLNRHSVASGGNANFTYSTTTVQVTTMGSVSDREGNNGLPYRSAGDPRTLSTQVKARNNNAGDDTVFVPVRWTVNGGATPIVMASGVEARLIEAEAALSRQDGSWLTILNDLRSGGITGIDTTIATTPTGADTLIDTVYAPGTGAVLFSSVGAAIPTLDPLGAPGSAAASVDLLFQERAYWMFLTGRRLPDMRRLVRQYGRDGSTVFPTGAYRAGPVGAYGLDMNLPAPPTENQANGSYSGCFDRQA